MGRNPEQNRLKKQDQQRQILSCALSLFARKGLAGTKISDIASAAGISQGLLYHYYPSKEDVFVALIRHAFERMTESARNLESLALSPRDKIQLALETLLKGFRDNGDAARFHLLIATATVSDSIPQEARTIIEQHNRLPYEVVERIFAQGQADGTIRPGDPKELALLFWVTIKGLAVHLAAYGNQRGELSVQTLMPLFCP